MSENTTQHLSVEVLPDYEPTAGSGHVRIRAARPGTR